MNIWAQESSGAGLAIGLAIALLAALAASWIVGLLIQYTKKRGILDVPNQRSSHQQPTPRGGGVGIVVVTLAGWLIFTVVNTQRDPLSDLIYVLCGVTIAALGWIDDIRSLPTAVRFAIHGLCALGIMWAFKCFAPGKDSPIPITSTALQWLYGLVIYLWIVGLLNAYNFMDGIDGIAGGQGAVAGVGWAITGWLAGSPALLVLGMLLAGSCAGFLRHNWSPARIFMGDVGSTFLGFSFAALPLMAARTDRSLMAVGIMLLWPFLFDAVFTFLRRLLNREKVWKPHRSHLYQRLTGAGSSHSVISRLYIGLAGCGMLVSFWWVSVVRTGAASSSKLALAIGILCLLALALCIGVMRKEKASANAT